MKELAAFVGHSFAKKDEDVVARVLKMLDTIKELMPGFDWDHALAAEPKQLSAKVLEKSQGKNVFIGICTAREQVLEAESISHPWWMRGGNGIVDESEVETKTSDWVIQEIGMAVGRGMDIILLLEEGVRNPGGLQGDLEYIPFTRNEPEQCMVKLASMLRSLSPKPIATSEARQEGPTSEPAVSDIDLWAEEFTTPTADWSSERFLSRLNFAFSIDSKEGQQRISRAFRDSEYWSDEKSRVTFEAREISARADSEKSEWLQPLRDLCDRYPQQPAPHVELGRQFGVISEFERAAENYEIAAAVSNSNALTVDCLTTAATFRGKASQIAVAEKLLEQAAQIVGSESGSSADGLALLAAAWKELGQTELFRACAERCLEIDPDRDYPRFALAFAYSEVNSEAEALFHYRQYVRRRNNPGAWNNLGVSASQLKLRIAAIDAYSVADRGGNTLATSNLAFAKLNAGFLQEAIEVCEHGMLKPERHPRLMEAFAQCERAREAEREEEAEQLEKTKVRREILRKVGIASLRRLLGSFPVSWNGPLCSMTAELNGDLLTMRGSYSRERSPLGLYGLGAALAGKPDKEDVRLEYRGRLFGEAFVGRVKTIASSGLYSVPSLLGGEDGTPCVGYINAVATEFIILEGKSNQYSLTRAET